MSVRASLFYWVKKARIHSWNFLIYADIAGMNEHVIRIKKPPHFSWKECLWFLDRGYDDCLFTINGDTIIKLITAGNDNILVQVTEGKKHLVVTSLNVSLTDAHLA